MTTNEVTTLPRVAVDMIKPGKTQPRTVFAEGSLRRLGETMLSAGVIQPIVVYRDADGMLALIAGERRWRAAKLVGIPELEYVEKPMPEMDAKARKMALIENLEREDLTPLEIAWAVRDQLAEKNEFDVPIYSRAQLADELGQDSHFILHCEALLKCSEGLQQKVHRGEVPMRLAAMIGSLPQSMHEMAEADVITRPGGMMTIDAAGRHFAENYKRDLRKAKFNKEISGLIPDAPECAKCPFNGANRSDVQGKLRAMVCLNPACFDAKQVTVVETARAHSDTGVGVQVLGNELRETIFSFDGVTVKGESGYVAADAKPDGILLVNPSAPCPTWGAMKEVEALKAVKIVDGEGALRTLYNARLALQSATAPDSAVKHLFKRAADVGGVSASVASGKTGLANLSASMMADQAAVVVDEEAKSKARESGKIAAAQSWVSKVKEAEDAPTMREIVRLILEKLTEGADRKWMGKVLDSEPMEYFDNGGMWDVLSLALVARVMRLQGPGGVAGVTGDLCKLVGYKPAQEAKAIDTMVEKAGKVKGEGAKAKAKEAKGEKPEAKGPEVEYPEQITPAVPEDAKPIYPPSTLLKKWIEDGEKPEVETQEAPEPAKPGLKPRVKDAEAERIAWEKFFETGSVKEAATACGKPYETVKNWYKRRKWKDVRAKKLAEQK